ncbi:MAG: hypothetical protein ACKVZJ_16065 [Phycisphaerales bacterium]
MSVRAFLWFPVVMIAACAASASCAQCLETQPIAPGDGVVPAGLMLAWDPDGPGAGGEELLAVGAWPNPGSSLRSALMSWDGQSWEPVASTPQPRLSYGAIVDGELWVSGNFLDTDPFPLSVFRDGRWRRLLSSDTTNDFEFARWIGTYQGQLHIVCQRTGTLRRWAGDRWRSIPATVLNTAALYEGRIVLARSGATYVNMPTVELWDGSTLSPLGPEFRGNVGRLLEYQGRLVAVGNELRIGSTPVTGPVEWDGTTWRPLGVWPFGSNAGITAICEHQGALIAAFVPNVPSGNNAQALARWDGSTWTAFGPLGRGNVSSMASFRGILAVNGSFVDENGIGFGQPVFFDGTHWFDDTRPTGQAVEAVLADDDGTLWIAGRVREGLGLYRATERGPELATEMLASIPSNSGARSIRALTRFNGTIYAAGKFGFESTLGVPPPGAICNVASLDAQGRWSPVGQEIRGTVEALVPYDGSLFAIGNFQAFPSSGPFSGVAVLRGGRWVGPETRLSRFRSTSLDNDAFCGVVFENSLIVGGNFTTAGQVSALGVARWNSIGGWSAMGPGLPDRSVRGLAVFQGRLYASGNFERNGLRYALAEWNGTTWDMVEPVRIFSSLQPAGPLHTGPEGLFLSGHAWLDGLESALLRFDGSSWQRVPLRERPRSFTNRGQETIVSTGSLIGPIRILRDASPPMFAGHPGGVIDQCTSSPVVLHVSSVGYKVPASYRWRINGVVGNPGFETGPSNGQTFVVGFRDGGPGQAVVECVVTDACGATYVVPAGNVFRMPDFNQDDAVTTIDLLDFLALFGRAGPTVGRYDVDGDGTVGTSDLVRVLGKFGLRCE